MYVRQVVSSAGVLHTVHHPGLGSASHSCGIRGLFLWCHLCLPGVICTVVVGVLVCVSLTVVLLVETLLEFLKLKEKKTHNIAGLLSGHPIPSPCCVDMVLS
jgi:hypothetical protein